MAGERRGRRDGWGRVSEGVWKMLKYTRILEEAEAEEESFIASLSDDELFFTPPQSPSSLSSLEQRCCDYLGIHRHYTPARAMLMLHLHDEIVEQLTSPIPTRSDIHGALVAKHPKRFKLSKVYIPSEGGSPGRTISFSEDGTSTDSKPLK